MLTFNCLKEFLFISKSLGYINKFKLKFINLSLGLGFFSLNLDKKCKKRMKIVYTKFHNSIKELLNIYLSKVIVLSRC